MGKTLYLKKWQYNFILFSIFVGVIRIIFIKEKSIFIRKCDLTICKNVQQI